ncbi:MAG: hypothetical protein OCD02_23810 [Spirochaetaceae bacterium]
MLKKIIITLIILFATTFIYADDSNIQCTIRYFNKTIYYPNKSIPVKLLIQNNTMLPKTFDIADQRSFNVDFVVETLQKERLPHREKFIIARNTNQPVFVREVRLEPGDEYNFIVDLAQYIVIDTPGLYRVTANFQTEVNSGNRSEILLSNTLVLSVMDGTDNKTEELLAKKITTQTLKLEALSPDEVVEYTILARARSQWNKFFLYLDLDRIFLNSEERERKFKRASEEEQLTMIENFKKDVMEGNVESNMIAVPYTYEITNTEYTPTESKVVVYTKFKFPDYTENKKYIYHLTKNDMVWYITSYEVLNLGTE